MSSLFGWRRGQTDEGSIKIFRHLPPQIVDGAVTLVRNIEDLVGAVGIGIASLNSKSRGQKALPAAPQANC